MVVEGAVLSMMVFHTIPRALFSLMRSVSSLTSLACRTLLSGLAIDCVNDLVRCCAHCTSSDLTGVTYEDLHLHMMCALHVPNINMCVMFDIVLLIICCVSLLWIMAERLCLC